MPIIWCIIFVIFVSVLKTALISVLEKEDVLMPRVSVWLVGRVTAVKSVGDAANCMYHSQPEGWKTCNCGHWPILRNLRKAPRLYMRIDVIFISITGKLVKENRVLIYFTLTVVLQIRNGKSVVNNFFLFLLRKLHGLLNRTWEMR